MQYDRLTRFFHLFIAFGITAQMFMTLVMVHPKPGREANVFFEIHEILGVALLGVLVAHWVWSLVRQGVAPIGHLFPWFSGKRLGALKADAVNHVKHLTKMSLPETDTPSPLAGAVQGLGLLAATLLGVTGLIILIYAEPGQRMVGWLHDVKEVHEAFGPVMWTYLGIHVGAGILHQIVGQEGVASMFAFWRKPQT